MNHIRFVPTTLADLKPDLQRHLTALPSSIESFIEDHIVQSNLYRIVLDADPAGFTAVHGGSLITQFYLEPTFRRSAQSIYSRVKKLEKVQAAFVPTCDEFFLSHALDAYRLLANQAYIFSLALPIAASEISEAIRLRPAEPADIETIRAGSGDFFGDIDACIRRQELYLTLHEGNCVGFGIMARSELCGAVASIGMYIREERRQQGMGTATLRLLQAECRREGRRPLAGCWYYNHLSKMTLESAGMVTQTRLLRIEY